MKLADLISRTITFTFAVPTVQQSEYEEVQSANVSGVAVQSSPGSLLLLLLLLLLRIRVRLLFAHLRSFRHDEASWQQ